MNAPLEYPFRRRGKMRTRRRETPPHRRKILFEALEPRLLLSAALVEADQQQSTQQLHESEATPSPVLIAVSPEASLDTDVTASTWIIETESGQRALQAADSDNVWRITGADAGTLNGSAFSGIGILLGGAYNEDTFIFEAGGSLSGYLEGGPGGFDTLVVEGGSFGSASYVASGPDSGTAGLDGNVIRYFGLEPIIDNSNTPDRVFTGTVGADHIRLIDAGTGKLTIESVNGTFESITFLRPSATLTIGGGGGDDIYSIVAADWGQLRITEAADGGDDRLDFNAYAGNFSSGSRISYTDEAVEHVVGVKLDTNALLSGLDSLVTWADALDNAGTLGQALAVLKGNVGVGLGASLDLADVFDQLRLDLKALVDSLPAGTSLTSDVLAERLAAFQKTNVSHFDRAIVGATPSPDLSGSGAFSFDIALDNALPVAITGQGADPQALVESLNASVSATSLLGRVQAIKTDDGRVGFQLIDTGVDKFALTATQGGDKLGFGAGPHERQNLTKVLGGLGKLTSGVEGAVVSELVNRADGTPELRFKLRYGAERSSQFNIDLGEAAAKQGVSFDAGSTLEVKSALEADLAPGMTLGATQDFFLDVGRFERHARAVLAGGRRAGRGGGSRTAPRRAGAEGGRKADRLERFLPRAGRRHAGNAARRQARRAAAQPHRIQPPAEGWQEACLLIERRHRFRRIAS